MNETTFRIIELVKLKQVYKAVADFDATAKPVDTLAYEERMLMYRLFALKYSLRAMLNRYGFDWREIENE